MKAKGPIRWSQICPDVQQAGFSRRLAVYHRQPAGQRREHERASTNLLPSTSCASSTIYWRDNFHLADQESRLLEECHRFLGYLKRFGSDRLTLGPPPPNVEDEAAAIRQTAKVMNGIGKIALDQYQIKADIHPHVGGLIENPRQIDALMRQTDPKYFSLAPDTAQLWMGGGDPVEIFEKYKHRIVYMHYKDLRAYNRSLRDYMGNVVELGRGVIDFPLCTAS